MVLRLSTFPSDVANVVLTGLSTATNAVITAADNVLGALGKLQAQISANALTFNGAMTGGTIDNTVIGGTTPASGFFATNSSVNGQFFVASTLFAGSGTSLGAVTVRGQAGNTRALNFQGFARAQASTRWQISANATAESGSNAGSDFNITRYNDAGSALDTPFAITRSTGLVTIIDGVAISGGATSTIDGAVIGATTPAAGTFTTLSASGTVSGAGFISLVQSQAATVAPLIDGTAAVGTSLLYARQDHVHPAPLPWINVRAAPYNATGNGTTDDTAAIQAAANAIPAAGGILYFPAGSYLLSNGIALKSSTYAIGDGRSSVLVASTSQVASTTVFADNALLVSSGGSFNGAPTVAATDISVENLAFDGTSAPTRGSFHCIRFGQVQRVRVEKCFFTNAGDGTALLGCQDTIVRDCFATGITNCGYDHWAGTSNALVDGCTVYCDSVNGQYGILFTASDTGNTVAEQAGNFRCTNNTIVNAPGAAIWCNVLTTLSGSDTFFCNISGNFINAPAISSTVGIKVSGPGTGHTIRGNTITSVNGGNSIIVSAEAGTVAPTSVNITGNNITDCTVSSGNVAYINCTGNDCLIAYNTFSGGTATNLVWVSGTQPVVLLNYGIGAQSGTTVSTSGATNPILLAVDNVANDLGVNCNWGIGGTLAVSGLATFGGGASVAGGSLLVGSPTGGSMGVGTINAQGVYVNGVAVGGSSYNPAAVAITGGTINGASIGATTPSTGAFTALSTSGVTTLQGSATNDNAATGKVGEFVSATVTVASPVAFTSSGVARNITSISLTAGDWDVSGMVGFLPAASTTFNAIIAGIGTTSATLSPPMGGAYTASTQTFTTGGAQALSVSPTRISIASTTTVFLVAQANFSVSTMNGYGFLRARRAR